jgi:hypothetical protein
MKLLDLNQDVTVAAFALKIVDAVVANGESLDLTNTGYAESRHRREHKT